MNKQPTMRALLEHLSSHGLLSADGADAIRRKLAPQEPPPPVFVRALVAVGAWLSATFFTAFVLATVFRGSQESSLAMGIGYLVGATLLHRVARHFFFHQVALALLVAGFILALTGVTQRTDGMHESTAMTLTAMALATLLYLFYHDDLQRFMMPLAAAGVAALSLFDYHSRDERWRLDIYAGLELMAAVVIFTNVRWRTRFKPLGYAMAVGVLLTLAAQAAWRQDAHLHWLFGQYTVPTLLSLRLVAAAAGLWVVRWAACDMRPELGRNNAWLRCKPVWAALCIAVLLGIIAPPGVLIALLLMVLGRGSAQRRLETLGVLSLAGFLTDFYYNMETGFLEKSIILVGSGVALLGAWWVLTRLLPETGEEACIPSPPPSPPPQP